MEAKLELNRKTALLTRAIPQKAAYSDGGTINLSRRIRPGEEFIHTILLICGAISIITTVGIVLVLLKESLLFFGSGELDLVEFLTDTVWQPVIGRFGIMPLVTATLMTSLIAMLVAVPLGLGAAIYLSEYAKPKARAILKPTLEMLAGVPTVVYGFFAILTVSPFLRNMLGQDTVQFQNMASAGLVMGFMIVPTIASMSEDALSAVPRSLREASYGLGGTRLETTLKVVVPAALSGILAAFILGVSRAVGETMIVALAAGSGPNLTFNPFAAAETMTGHIVRISGGEISYNSIDYNSLFAIGLTLFLVTIVLNLISQYVTNRFRESYE
jgi:phosphate transport system permease protein